MRGVWRCRRCWVVPGGNWGRRGSMTICPGSILEWISCGRSCRTLSQALWGKFIRICSLSTLTPLRSNEGLWFIALLMFVAGRGPLFLLNGRMCLRASCRMRALRSSSPPFLIEGEVWCRGSVKSFYCKLMTRISGRGYRESIVGLFVGSIVFSSRLD